MHSVRSAYLGLICLACICCSVAETPAPPPLAFDATALTSAWVKGIWYFERADGSQQRGPVTIVYVQQGDEYRIAHMNFSSYLDDEVA